MKKIALIFLLLVSLAVILLVCTSSTGLRVGSVSLATDADKTFVEEHSMDFLEDIRYKDFKKAATYHNNAERKTVDIPNLIERIFLIKPEFIDIMRYQVTSVDMDRSGERARVHAKVVLKVLNTGEIKEPEIILYWYKDPREGWCMRLESSLR